MLRSRVISSLSAIDAGAWNSLIDGPYPFVRHEFLSALEQTGCVNADAGWQAAHLLLEDGQGQLRAAAPLYLKDHSFGEFVFDFAWANAYARTGQAYYPKLLCAVPYSPVVGPRLLARNDSDREALAHTLVEHMMASQASSMHMLFAAGPDRTAMQAAGAELRRDCHYQWLNRDYASFDAFLQTQSSKRRKEIRRERRRVNEMGVHLEVRRAEAVEPALMRQLYLFYARTYLIRGQQPYLSYEFFERINDAMADYVRYFIAFAGEQPVGMAFMLDDGNQLYGRHWGCLDDYHSLHFETCYYAGIDYCIEHGRERFDAGAQGEHKIRRGFEPMATYSAHLMRPQQMHSAVADFLAREAAVIAEHHAELRARCAFPDAAERTP